MAQPREDQNVIAIFDGLAWLTRAVNSLLLTLSEEDTNTKESRIADSIEYTKKAEDIFRKAASEASGSLDTQNSKETKDK